MNPEIKARWVRALRSGEYRQTRFKLRAELSDDEGGGYGFCCLGVLCELAVADGVIERRSDNYGIWENGMGTDSSDAELPDVVQAWAGLEDFGSAVYLPDGLCLSPDGHGEPGDPDYCTCMAGSLAEANDDGGQNFAQIADLIEEHL